MTIPLTIHNRKMVIPVEIKVGYDWKNMVKWGTKAADEQVRRVEPTDILHRSIL